MRKKIFVVLLLVVVLITSVGCNHESNPKAYQLDYYMETIQGHVIISAVCVKSDGNGTSVSSVNVGTTRQSKEKGYYGEETEF